MERYPSGNGRQRVQAWFAAGGAKPRHLHTSGHASVADLRTFAAAINRAIVVPNGERWDEDVAGFPPVRRVADGETMVI